MTTETMGSLSRVTSLTGGKIISTSNISKYVCLLCFSVIKKSRDDYVKRLNGIYFNNLEKVCTKLKESVLISIHFTILLNSGQGHIYFWPCKVCRTKTSYCW